MISSHIPTTCQPALLAEVLTWVPLPPASLTEKSNADCTAVFVVLWYCCSFVFNGLSYPPPLFYEICDFTEIVLHFSSSFYFHWTYRVKVSMWQFQSLSMVEPVEPRLFTTSSMVCWPCVLDTHTHTSHTKVKRLVPLFPHLRSQPHAHDLEVPHHQLPAASLLAPNAKLFVWLVSFFQHMNVKRNRSDLANFDGTNSLEDLSSNGNLGPNVLDL